MNNKTKYLQIVFIVSIVVICVLILTSVNLKNNQSQQIFNVTTGNLPALGSNEAPIKIIEFGDFLCPFCGRAVTNLYPQLENLINEGKVAIYFRDFIVHLEAMPIHNAARCANEQGKYWEFNKELFIKLMNGEIITNKEVWLSLAKNFNLNIENFEKCINDNKYLNDVQNDTQEAIALGLTGTPTFFVNGKKIEGINIPLIMSTINQLLQ